MNIQGNINSALFSAGHAAQSVRIQGELSARNRERQHQEEYANLAHGLYGDVLKSTGGPRSPEYRRLMSRQEEANALVEEYQTAANAQRKAMQAKYNAVGGKRSPQGKPIYKQGLKQKENLINEYKSKLSELTKQQTFKKESSLINPSTGKPFTYEEKGE